MVNCVLSKGGQGRYLSLKTPENRILHIHHKGSAKGEIHLDIKFWSKLKDQNGNLIDLNELMNILKTSYNIRELKKSGDIRIEGYKK